MDSLVCTSFTTVVSTWFAPAALSAHVRVAMVAASAQPLPSWWTERHLLFVLCAISGAMIAALLWGAILRRRMTMQTNILRRTMAQEAARERRRALLERERGRVLEAINSSMPLDQVMRMVTAFLSDQMGGIRCWCVAHNGLVVGSESSRGVDLPVEDGTHSRRDILTPGGDLLGVFILEGTLAEETHGDSGLAPGDGLAGDELLDMGVSLAALAIDNRRLYEDLVRRSEYDQLTDIPNRFLLDCRITDALGTAQQHRQRFSLVYIDLDRFKRVNDRFGHRVGDLYLQKVAKRLSELLRSRDTLARVGGDEFIALIPIVRDRSEAEEIARRLEESFSFPFDIDGLILNGTASIGVAVYPDDGQDVHELKLVADAAMYSNKQRSERHGRHVPDFTV